MASLTVITAHRITSLILGNELVHAVVRGVGVFGGSLKVTILILRTLLHVSIIIFDALFGALGTLLKEIIRRRLIVCIECVLHGLHFGSVSIILSCISLTVVTAHRITSLILGNELAHAVVRGVGIFGGSLKVTILLLRTLFHVSMIIFDVVFGALGTLLEEIIRRRLILYIECVLR